MNCVRKIVDATLEATIVGSFSKIGFTARDKLYGLVEPRADLTGQRAMVTGASSGIGQAVAAGLLSLGADVVVTSRDQGRADSAANELNEAADGGRASGLALDTADFDSIHAATNELRLGSPLDMLCHNAGALSDTYSTNNVGMETTLASHLVGPYALTNDLKDFLTPGARVVWMASGGMYAQELDVKRIEMREKSYRGAVAYARAKRGQVEMVSHLGPQWAPDIIMHAMHPGWVDTPGVEEGLPGFRKIAGPVLRSAEQGADTMIWLAATGGGSAAPGSFWLDRKIRRTAYLPGTRADDTQRGELVDWLDLVSLPATVG